MKTLKFVGLDVHKESIVLAVAERDGDSARVLERLPNDSAMVLKRLRKLGPLGTLKVCYEAGPTGYGLHRFLTDKGVACDVVAPALIPQLRGSRLKTDRRDAVHLAHFLRSGDLTAVWVPDPETEAIRDLVRARDDARLALRRIRQQLLKFLLRHERRFTEGKSHWTKTHLQWIKRQKFTSLAQQLVLEDAQRTLEEAEARVRKLDQDLADSVMHWKRSALVRDLQAFHGVSLLTAAGVAAEIGDFSRFPTASRFMAFVGLVPSEQSSGETRRQGRITKTGNRHVRRLLIEAAWNYYGNRAKPGTALTRRREHVPAEIIATADRALRRLRRKSLRLQMHRKSATKIAAALARELAGFLWAAARLSEQRFTTTG
jgi:transposase